VADVVADLGQRGSHVSGQRGEPAQPGPRLGCRTLARFEEERIYLSSTGIPAGLLPGARDLGRLDLL
jgi:hypothetical protein